MQKDVYRKRPHEIRACADDHELSVINKNIEMSGLSRREYIISRCMNILPTKSEKQTVIVAGGPELLRELSRIGTNLNESTKKLNEVVKYIRAAYEGFYSLYDAVVTYVKFIEDTANSLKATSDEVRKAVEEIQKIGRK